MKLSFVENSLEIDHAIKFFSNSDQRPKETQSSLRIQRLFKENFQKSDALKSDRRNTSENEVPLWFPVF